MRKLYNTREEKLQSRRDRTYKKSYERSVLREHCIERIPIAGCWLWTAKKWKDGYGYFMKEGKAQAAHRYMYALYKGNFDKNLHVLHTCDNPSCVNPEHLWLGTQKDNMQDMHKKGRGRKYNGFLI